MSEQRRSLRPAAGVTLSCIEAGPDDGPLVILLHGFPEDAQSWSPQVEALAAAGFRVLAPDQRGYGASDKPAGIEAYLIDTLAADVIALAASLGRERFDLVGHDWGGVVAWWVGVRHPERLGRLAILNAPHPKAMQVYMRRVPVQALRSLYMAAFQLPTLPEAALGAGNFALLTRVLVRTSRPGAFSAADLARYRQAWAAPGAMTAMLNWYRALRLKQRTTAPSPRTPRSRRIAVPTLVLWGARDAFLGRGLAAASAALCDDARLLYFETASHWLQQEEPQQVAAALVAFLKGEPVGDRVTPGAD